MLIGAINAANDKVNSVQSQLTGEWGPVPKVAQEYRDKGIKWVVIGEFDFPPGLRGVFLRLEVRERF